MLRRLSPLLVAVPITACGGADGAVTSVAQEHSLEAPSSFAGPRALGLHDPDVPVHAYVVLEGAPAVAALPSRRQGGATLGPDRVRRRLAELEAQHAQVKPELEAAGALIVGDLVRLANAVQVVAPARSLPAIREVAEVVRIDPVNLLVPTKREATPRIGAPEAWALPAGLHGEGIVVGIIDTGIDYTHFDFAGDGEAAFAANDSTVVEPGTFPTARVIGGVDFAGNAYDAQSPGQEVPEPDPDPLDCGGHGTHVAGITAGNGVLAAGAPYDGPYDLSFDDFAFRVVPGVAPRASLYALKVFGCDGATGLLGLALERAADPNEDGDFSDRLDVINGSLGSEYGLGSETEGAIIANLASLGTLVVAAAGNDGSVGRPFYALGSPAAYPEILSVAATLNDANEFPALDIDSPPELAGEIPYAEGTFAPSLAAVGPITGRLVRVQPDLGCEPYSNAQEVAGEIAFVDRGSCTFVEKFQNASAAGASAILIVDNQDSDTPFGMSGQGFATIPGVMVRKQDGDRIRARLDDGVMVTLTTKIFPGTQGPDYVADFSSRGPTAEGTLLKPEISAPGQPIISADTGSGDGARFSQGTSQASPFVAGAAALVAQARPDFTPADIKAVLMNTAVPVVGISGDPFPVSLAGSGRVQVDAAVQRTVTARSAAHPAGIAVSLGAIVASEPRSESRKVVVRNHGQTEVTFAVEADPTRDLLGITATAEPRRVSVAPGATVSVTLTLTVDPAALAEPVPDAFTPATIAGGARHFNVEAGGHVRFIDEADGSQTISLPYHSVVRAAARRSAGEPGLCAAEPDRVVIPIGGPSAHATPVTTAFQLVAQPGQSDPESDVMAVGVATDFDKTGSVGASSLFVGVALRDEWATPAQGPLSVVRLLFDSNGDSGVDFIVGATPQSEQMGFPFFSDLLQVVVTDLASESRLEPPGLLNMVPPFGSGYRRVPQRRAGHAGSPRARWREQREPDRALCPGHGLPRRRAADGR